MIAVVGGVTLAVTAGARRTATAFDRLRDGDQRADRCRSSWLSRTTADGLDVPSILPSATSLADEIAAVRGVDGVAVATFMGATPIRDGVVAFAVVPSASRRRGAT